MIEGGLHRRSHSIPLSKTIIDGRLCLLVGISRYYWDQYMSFPFFVMNSGWPMTLSKSLNPSLWVDDKMIAVLK